MTTPTMSRWYSLRPHAEQRRLWESAARFNVVPAGRRSGKSEITKRRLVSLAIAPQRYPNGKYVFAAPTHQQAKRIAWRDLKAMVPRWALPGADPRRAISEGELSVRFLSGAEILVVGLDVPERIEGSPIDHIVLDEYGNMKESAWDEHVRPALSERAGTADLIGVPEGRNHYWRKAEEAKEDDSGLWDFFSWPSADILPAEEIEIARAELDQRTFEQEYEASFLDATGRGYYSFGRDIHVERVEYNPSLPLYLCLDFNVSPGVGLICQEQMYQGSNIHVDRRKAITAIVDEIWLKTNSNTIRVCEEFLSKYRSHQGPVRLYGDSSGGARHTSQVSGSDWDLVRKIFAPVFGRQELQARNGKHIVTAGRLISCVPQSNPPVRARINAVNSRLRSVDGTVRLLVDPRCRHTVEDLEGVTWAPDGHDIDKKASPMLSHISDALGYYVFAEHPIARYQSTWQQV